MYSNLLFYFIFACCTNSLLWNNVVSVAVCCCYLAEFYWTITNTRKLQYWWFSSITVCMLLLPDSDYTHYLTELIVTFQSMYCRLLYFRTYFKIVLLVWPSIDTATVLYWKITFLPGICIEPEAGKCRVSSRPRYR